MIKHLLCILSGLTLITFSAARAPQASARTDLPQPKKEYRFAASSNSHQLEKEMNDAATDGFRLEFLSDAFTDSKIGVLLSRTPVRSQADVAATQPRFEYKVLGANKISTMRKELEDAAAQGYELRGLTANASIFAFTVSETIAVMERESGQAKQKYEYQFLNANREETLQKALDVSVGEGFHPAAMSVNRDNNAASVVFGLPVFRYDLVMRRDIENPSAEKGTREYRFVSTMKVSTLEKEINHLAEKGFRCHLISVGAVALMARDINATQTHRYEYKLVFGRRTGTLAKELAEASRKGLAYRGSSGLVAVMETDHSEQAKATHDYKLLAAMRIKTTRKELDESLAAGYEPVHLMSLGEFIIILDKAGTTQ